MIVISPMITAEMVAKWPTVDREDFRRTDGTIDTDAFYEAVRAIVHRELDKLREEAFEAEADDAA